MGSSIITKCFNCGRVDEYKTGGGMVISIPDIDNLIGIVNSKSQVKILTDLRDNFGAYLEESPGYQVFECKHCETLYQRFTYEVILNDGTKYSKKEFKCPKCRNILSKINDIDEIDITKNSCKKCGEKELFFHGFTRFD